MQPEVYLESIEFGAFDKVSSKLNSVQVNLSNGESSPLIIKDSWSKQYYPETFNFDHVDKPIRAVAASDDGHSAGRISFMSLDGKEVQVYNPTDIAHKTNIYQLSENEELIGVYGVKGKGSWFTSFGFIVKKTS